MKYFELIHCFNPRTHEECDDIPVHVLTTLDKFQSTHSRGVRHPVQVASGHVVGVSIHALTRSATVFSWMIENKYCVSIHALTRSATVTYEKNNQFHGVSIHALTRSATMPWHISMQPSLFQSTHSRGVRPHIFFLFYFQIFRTRFSRIFLKNIKSKR